MPHPFFHISLVSWRSIFFLILCVAVGFAGGIMGSTLLIQEDEPFQFTQPPVQQFPLIFDPGPQEAREQTPSILLQKFESSIFEVWNIGVKQQKNDSNSPSQNRFLGYCLGITSDGWLVTSLMSEKDTHSIHVFNRFKKEFSLQNRIDDSIIGVTYLKISNTSIHPIQFSQSYTMTPARFGYVLEDHRLISELYLSSPMYQHVASFEDAIQNTATIKTRFNPTQKFSNPGIPIVSRRGELLGITDKNLGIIPAEYIKDSVDMLLRQETSLRTSLAIPYVDIRSVPFLLDSQKVAVPSLGALVVSDKNGITLSTPQQPFNLKNDDLIMRVNSDIIDINRSFAEIIHQYKRGDNVTLTIQRNGKEISQKIILP